MKYCLILLFTVLALQVSAQTDNITMPPPVYQYAEQMPEPSYDILKYLSENIKYPDSAIIKNTSGRVIVKFVVYEDGTINDCQVVRGIGSGCDEEALRVIKNMPPWKPGRNNGKAVRVYYNQPIAFELAEPDSTHPIVEVYHDVDINAEPEYGMASYLKNYLQYPVVVREKGIQGKVTVKFIVSDHGIICNSEIAKSSGNDELDNEALWVVKNMPPWTPPIKNGKPVNCWYNQDVSFNLGDFDSTLHLGKVDTNLEKAPEPTFDMNTYLAKNMQYPSGPRDKGIQGRVVVKFIISNKGIICNCEIARSTGNAELDAEALRVIKNMPRWKPGINKGKAVYCYFSQPINFSLK